MRRGRLLIFTSVLSACSLISSPTVTTEPGPLAPPDTETTGASTTTTTTTLPADAIVTTETLSTVGCDEADETFEVLCRVIEVIETSYVDDIPLETLADAAIRGITEFAERDQSTEAIECAIPNEAFVPVCHALDDSDAEVTDGLEAALRGMIAFGLDPNSAYLNPEALALEAEDQTGSVEGIGALVNTEDRTSADPTTTTCPIISDTCRMVIISTLTGSPAEAAGLQPGDELVSVDGLSPEGLGLDELTSLVRGPSGSDVALVFLRDNETFSVTITRAAIEIPIAEWEVIGSTGYLRLNLFTNNSDETVRRALEELVAGGATDLIFDLRNNPGGSLDSSVEIASEFLSDGLVLRTESPDEIIPYDVRSGGTLTDPSFPVTILVNGGSASASEVVSGALKEADRAVLIGENTFGKNTVQQRFPLPNGGAVKVTIARWVTPSGADFGEFGITPDVEADLPITLTPAEVVELVNNLVS